jgi:hypothetical protein
MREMPPNGSNTTFIHSSIALPIEEKESIKWINSLNTSNNSRLKNTKIVTICDREADIYDFFEVACGKGSSVLVRARQDRTVNKKSLHSKKSGVKLWDLIKSFPCQGEIEVVIPARDNKPSRTAVLEVRFGEFVMSPSKNNAKHKTEQLPNLKLNALYIVEKSDLGVESPLEWVLLTNLPLNNFESAVEKIRWYCLRWRIEIFHKILKSGLHVEECRLGPVTK